jgi:RNA-binding protein 26
MGSVRDYFGQFGDVTNVAIEGNSRRALVSFATNREAYQAWKSDDAVFGSRHVKVLWHRPLAGHGEAGQKKLEASSQLIANMKKLENGDSSMQGDKVAQLEGPESRLKKTLAELEVKEKQQKRETLIAEQKVLFARAASASTEDKMTILGRIKEIAKEMQDLNRPSPPPDADVSAKDKLDAELAKHGMETSAGGDEELLKLNAQLTALKDKVGYRFVFHMLTRQASTLGIPANRYSPYGRGSPRGRASRGRGRGGFQRPMRLDNRSKTVLITGEALDSDSSQAAVREWYESTGGAISNGDDGVLVTYPTREMAEKVSCYISKNATNPKALALGTGSIPNVSVPLKAAWHAGSQPGSGYGTPTHEMTVESNEVEMEDGERPESDLNSSDVWA